MNDLPLPPRAIALSKTKLLLLLLGACLFVALGVWMVQQDPAEIAARRRYNIPWLVHGIGVANIVFLEHAPCLLSKNCSTPSLACCSLPKD